MKPSSRWRKVLNPIFGLSRRRSRPSGDNLAKLRFELLEDRIAPAVVSWDGGGGNLLWTTAANWSGDNLPTANDDVEITSANGAVVLDSGDVMVRSIKSSTAFSLAGSANFVVTAGESDVASLLVGSGRNLSAFGAMTRFAVSGIANINGANLYADAGAIISLPGATTYTHPGGFVATIRASGAGTTIDLRNITNITGSQSGNTQLIIEALDGGTVDLRGVTNVVDPAAGVGDTRGRATRFKVEGPNSLIDLSALTSLIDQDPNNLSFLGLSALQATAGGTIRVPSLITVSATEISLDQTGHLDLPKLDSAANSTFSGPLDLAKLKSATNCTFTIAGANRVFPLLTTATRSSFTVNGVNVSVPALIDINGASFFVNGGVTLSFPATVTNYIHPGGLVATIRASGAGTTIDLRNITNITGSQSGNTQLNIEALDGGTVDLRGVTNVVDPAAGVGDTRGRATRFKVEGPNSLIDLSALTSLIDQDPNNLNFLGLSALQATAGGTIRVPNLITVSATEISLDQTGHLDLPKLDSAANSTFSGPLDLAKLKSATNCTFTIAGANRVFPLLTTATRSSFTVNGVNVSVPALIDINGASFFVNGGVTLSFPATVTNYIHPGGLVATIRASGAGTTIDLRNITNITGSQSGNTQLNIEALDGGTVDLRGVTNVVDPAAGVGDTRGRATRFKVEGPNSLIDLSALTSLIDQDPNNLNFLGLSALQAAAGGNIQLSSAGVVVSNTEVVLNGGRITGSISLGSGSILQGSGTISGHVTNSGITQPGGLNLAGQLIVTGNYTQTANGTLEIDLGGVVQGASYDRLSVGGTATLANTLVRNLINGFTPSSSNVFQFLTATSRTGAFTTHVGAGISASPFLVASYASASASLAVSTSRIAVSPTSGLVTTEAGGTATFFVALAAAPTADVTIPISTGNAKEGTVSTSLLTFTSNNWTNAQQIAVTGVSDAIKDGDQSYIVIIGNAVSTDANFNGLNPADVQLTNIAADSPGITITPIDGLTTSRGGDFATFTVVLKSQPASTVSIGFTVNNPSLATLSTPSVTFTPANWGVPQQVTVFGVVDTTSPSGGPRPYVIVTAPATSSDPDYDGTNPDDINASNLAAGNLPPTISSNGAGPTAAIDVAEGTTAVTTVSAIDPDPGTVLTYTIVGGADASKFQLGAANGVLAFRDPPAYSNPTDAGANRVYDVIVQASNGLVADTQAIAVTVTPVYGIVYVDDDWAALANGAPIPDADATQAGNQSAIVGTTAFASLSPAIQAVAVGGTVAIAQGNYSQAAILSKSLSLKVLTGAATIGGVLSGPAGFAKTGNGTLTLSGANSYLGGTFVNQGKLLTTSDAALGDSSGGVTINALGEWSVTANMTSSRTIALNGGVLAVNAGTTLTLSGASLGGGFLKGPGTIATVTGATTFVSGTTAQSSLTFIASGGGTFRGFTNNGNFTVSTGQNATFDGYTNASAGRLTIAATAAVAAADFITNGQIMVNGTLTNTGSSGLTFGGGSITTINSGGKIDIGSADALVAGGLVKNNGAFGSTTNKIIIDFGAKVKGTGGFGEFLTQNGGLFAPGNSPGAATTSKYNVNGGGGLEFEISNATGAAGNPSGWDLIKVQPTDFNPKSGVVAVSATPADHFTIMLASRLDSGDRNMPGSAANFEPSHSYAWKFIDASDVASRVTGWFDPNAFSIDASDFSNAFSGTFGVELRDGGKGLYVVYSPAGDDALLDVNRPTNGRIDSPSNVDRWHFTAAVGQEIRFDLINSAFPGIRFRLTGPSGETIFDNLGADSNSIALAAFGNYTLTAYSTLNSTGAYTFQLLLTSQTPLQIGVPYSGTLVGSGYAQIFRVTMPEGRPLVVTLDDATNTDHNEIYLRYNAIPSRGDYDFRSETVGVDQRLLSPYAAPGTWYVLVYADAVPAPSSFVLRADSSPIMLTEATPNRLANDQAATLTLTGGGFVQETQVVLVSGGSSFTAQSVAIESFGRMSATFDLRSATSGAYAVRVTLPGGATAVLPNAVHVTSVGQPKLETHLILPNELGRNAVATLYVEYSNIGTAAMPAPILVLQSADPDGSDRPLLTLDQSRVVAGFWTSAQPDGFSNSVQFLGSGATPGLLLPGEKIMVPVYYAGLQKTLQQPWDLSDKIVEFEIRILQANDATQVGWTSLKSSLRPSWIAADAWEGVFANLVTQFGTTRGDYVRLLSQNASYLGHLGAQVTDISKLYGFEVQQAIGLNPDSSLVSAVDAKQLATGLPLAFGRAFGSTSLARNRMGPFGRGWAAEWQISLEPLADKTVVLHRGADADHRFQPDSRLSRSGVYFGQAGDTAALQKLPNGAYELTEANGQVTRFKADGTLDYVRENDGNRITATLTNGRLTQLTHSNGATLMIAYNAADLISSILDKEGRMTTYSYDATNNLLQSAKGPDGVTTFYTYESGANAAMKYALTSVSDTSGPTRRFEYDSRGRLSVLDAGNAPVFYSYDAAGGVTRAGAAGSKAKYYFDDRGLVVRDEDTLGSYQLYDYDAARKLTKITDSLGRPITEGPTTGTTAGASYALASAPLPLPPGELGDSGSTHIPDALDPNEKLGVAGYGAKAFLSPNTAIPYTIKFENLGSAAVPAQRVEITDQLPTNLDWSTFQFSEAGFGDVRYKFERLKHNGVSSVHRTYKGNDFDVAIDLSFDYLTGEVSAVLQTIDPNTTLPPNVLKGFLPPEDGSGRGQGYIAFTVEPQEDLPTGTEIRNVGYISFDRQTAISTDQVNPQDPSQGRDPQRQALNTIDAGAPARRIDPFASPTTNSRSFPVSWSGADDVGGSGIAENEVYVSTNNGPFSLWLTQPESTPTNPTFNGELENSYTFYALAIDNVGNRQPVPDQSQWVTITVTAAAAMATTTTLAASQLATTGGTLVMFTATVAPSPGTAGTVTFLDNGIPIPSGSDKSIATGVAVFSTASLAIGSHPVTASFSGAPGFLSSVSKAPVIVEIANAPPPPSVVSVIPNGGSMPFTANQRSRVINLTVAFSQAVQLDSNAVVVALHTNNVSVGGVAQPGGTGSLPTSLNLRTTDNIVWTVTFSGNTDIGSDGIESIKDGIYDVNIDGAKVHPNGFPSINMAGFSKTTFHRLFGDTNLPSETPDGNGGRHFQAIVNTGDNLQLRGTFNSATNYKAFLDFNGDGIVNTGDNLQFRSRFNKGLSWTV